MSLKRTAAATLLAAAALQGCATLIGDDQQQLAVYAILDHREVNGVGCVLSNPAGRWFVTTPGLVTIHKNQGELVIDCKKDGVGAAREVVRSQFGTGKMIGNAVVSAGLGYYLDRRSGAGFDYPATLTVMLRPAAEAADARAADPGQGASTPVY